MSRIPVWVAVAVCLAVTSAACDVKVGQNGLSVDLGGGNKATDEWTRTYDIAAGGRVEVVNVNGAVRLSPADGGKVEVHAFREARASSEQAARELLGKIEMKEDVGPDHVSIQAADPPQGGGFGRPALVIRYEVRVPSGLAVALKTQNGEVRLENVAGRFTAGSTNGGVTGRALSGSVDASTVNGGIQMELDSLSADTKLSTVNGGVRVTVGPELKADLEATVVNGGVSVDDALKLSSDDRGRQRIAGRINGGGPKLLVQTTNGGVRVAARGGAGS
jgi:hypothetical protein